MIFVIQKTPASSNMIRRIIPLVFYIFLTINLTAQTTLNRETQNTLFNEALMLVNKNNLSAARSHFEEFIRQQPASELLAEAKYFKAYCAMHLFNDDAEKLFETFVADYPNHPKAMLAYFELGNFYYRNKKFQDAVINFEKVKLNNLSNAQKNELKFKLGYSYFTQQKFDNALNHFNYSLENENSYRGASAYYAAFITLENNNYNEALRYIEIAAEYEAYDKVVPFLKTKALYGLQQYDDVIAYAHPLLISGQSISDKNALELLVAESFYFKGDYRNAFAYYEAGIDQSLRNEQAELLYRAGFTAFQNGYYDEASDYLKNAALSDEAVGQFASYYLGLAYIKNDNKTYAITAFEKATKKTFSRDITYESMYYLGKLYFEAGRYKDALEVLQDYSQSSYVEAHREEVNELISESYVNTDDVNTAIEYIESIPNRSQNINRVYQYVTFKKANELFNAGKYFDAVQMFRRSLENPVEQELVLKSHFWIGEAYSIGKRYEEAIESYLNVIRNDPTETSETLLKTRYGLGYAYFNTKAYDKALGNFTIYVLRVQRNNQQYYYDDALLRLADCYYVTKDYNNAITTYERAIDAKSNEPDYCYFQIGLIQSILGNRQKAERNFDLVLNRFGNSVFKDDALFQRSQVAFENGDYITAIDRYTNLIQDESQSPFIPFALVDRALSYFNLKNYEACINDYQRVIDDFPRHSVANDALLGLQEALTAVNRSDNFGEYLDKYKTANPEDKDLASVEFESAKSFYFNQKYNQAIKALNQYQSDYPASPFEYDVYYYLGESYYRSGSYPEAIGQLLHVAGNRNSQWYSRAVNRVAMLFNETNENQKAKQYFRLLEKIASNRRMEFDAWSGLMEAYFKIGQYDSAIYFGDQILNKGAFSVNAQNRAQLYLGKAYLEKGDFDNAIDYFLNTVNTAKDAHGAEAQYHIASIYHDQGNYKRSNEALFNLNDTYGIYEEWIGKSFLLIAENFIAMDELFQAQATLNSVIEKSPVESITKLAKERLTEIEILDQKTYEEDTLGIN